MNPRFLNKPIYRRGEAIGDRLIRPLSSFAALQASGGIVIGLATVVALVWANSSFADSYHEFWHTHWVIGRGKFVIDQPLHFWVNDGLMAIFFFVVGLEIKREVLVGELSSYRQALLPVSAAIGGMVVPALIYFGFTQGTPSVRGWGIPMATDIAFTIGAITVLGSRVPRSLLVFLTALAIADDLGAVLVIALFYTSNIVAHYLLIAIVFLVILGLFNFLGFQNPFPYVVIGCFVWVAVYLSGVHATVAGILVAMTIPARSRFDTDTFLQSAHGLLDEFNCAGSCGYSVYSNEDHQSAIHTLRSMCCGVEPPLHRIEYSLHPWVIFGIVPLFALANAGVHLDWKNLGVVLSDPTPLGIIFGLIVGKQIGITFAVWVAIKTGIAVLPRGLKLKHVYGGAILCGMGFTMSLFIANLAFGVGPMLDLAKIGILVASLLALILGLGCLYATSAEGDDHLASSRVAEPLSR